MQMIKAIKDWYFDTKLKFTPDNKLPYYKVMRKRHLEIGGNVSDLLAQRAEINAKLAKHLTLESCELCGNKTTAELEYTEFCIVACKDREACLRSEWRQYCQHLEDMHPEEPTPHCPPPWVDEDNKHLFLMEGDPGVPDFVDEIMPPHNDDDLPF